MEGWITGEEVPDPFYPEKIKMVTIPRELLETLFKMAPRGLSRAVLSLRAISMA